jgi:hypothetical protein
MATGGHIIAAGDGENLFHLEEGVGFGRFPAIPDNLSFFANFHIDAVSLDDIWIGHWRSTGGDSYVSHWDGIAATWTTYTLPDNPDNCMVCVSVDRASGVVWAMGDGGGSGWRVCWKYTPGSGWQRQWQDAANDEQVVPLARSSSLCYFISESASGGVRLFSTSGGTPSQYPSGLDLPDGGYRGICEMGGEIFLLTATTGQVWRGVWGSFVLDNSSDGPFAASAFGASMATSADGQTVVVSANNDYYARNGPDDWSSVGPVGGAGVQYQPAAISRQILLSNWANNTRVSYDGGANWVSTTSEGGYGAAACIGDVSEPDKRLLALYYFKATYSLWWKGDDKYSPWARWNFPSSVGETYPRVARLDDVTAFSTRFTCIESFDAGGEIVVGIETGGTGGSPSDLAWHYDPVGDAWIVYKHAKRPCRRIFGTEYAVGRIHAVGESGGGIDYFRWNGSGYDDTAIPGSTSGSTRWNISASDDGQDIWITVDGSQLWHSSDGGSTWANRHAASAAIHANAGDAVDVWVISSTNVVVVHDEVGAGGDLYFSKWNGSSWSVAAPAMAGVYVDQKCLFVDTDSAYWIITMSGGLFKLIGGAWNQEELFWSHNHSPTDFEAFEDLSVMALSLRSPDSNHLDVDHADLALGWYTCQAGGNTPPSAQKWVGLGEYNILGDPPVVTNRVPACNEKDVYNLSDYEFDITDPNGNLDPSTIKVWVNGLLVWSNSSAVGDWSGFTSVITNGLHFTLIPSVAYRTLEVSVRIYGEDAKGNIVDDTCVFYPSIDLILSPVLITQRLVRVNFNHTISPTSVALDKNNYVVTVAETGVEEIDVLQVLYDPDRDALSYVDLYLSRTTLDTEYLAAASELTYAETGSAIGNTIGGLFTAQKTKVDSLVSNMSQPYNTSIQSNLFYILAAIGIIDEEIGGDRLITVPSGIAVKLEEEASTYGTATYGTDTYGG